MKLKMCANFHYYNADKDDECPYCDGNMLFNIIQGNIEKVPADAVVNAVNTRTIFANETECSIYE